MTILGILYTVKGVSMYEDIRELKIRFFVYECSDKYWIRNLESAVDTSENVDDDISGVGGDNSELLLHDMLDGKEVQDQSCGTIFELFVYYNKSSFTSLPKSV